MISLPHKKVIGLVIFLVVVAISVFWYVGYQDKKTKAELKAKYLQEFLSQQSNLEKLATQDLENSVNKNGSVLLNIPPKPKLNIIDETTATTWRQYGLDLTKALEPLGRSRANEIKSSLTAIDNNDATPLKEVVKSRLYHEEAVNNLSGLTVPKDLVKRHQTLVVNLGVITGLIKNMEQALNQPTLALSSGKLLPTNYQVFLDSLSAINNDLISRKVIFTKEEQAKIYLSFLK